MKNCNVSNRRIIINLRFALFSSSPKHTCYRCRNKIRIDTLEEVFHQQLKSFFFSPSEIESYLNKADEVIKEKEDLLRILNEEKRKIEQEMDKTYRLCIDGEITNKGFGKKYKPLEERLTQVEDEIPELQAEIDFLRIQYLSSDQILHEAKDLYSGWLELIPEEKRKILETITEKMTVGKEDVTINLCYLPSSSEMMTSKQCKFTCVLVPEVNVRCGACVGVTVGLLRQSWRVTWIIYFFTWPYRCKFV